MKYVLGGCNPLPASHAVGQRNALHLFLLIFSMAPCRSPGHVNTVQPSHASLLARGALQSHTSAPAPHASLVDDSVSYITSCNELKHPPGEPPACSPAFTMVATQEAVRPFIVLMHTEEFTW